MHFMSITLRSILMVWQHAVFKLTEILSQIVISAHINTNRHPTYVYTIIENWLSSLIRGNVMNIRIEIRLYWWDAEATKSDTTLTILITCLLWVISRYIFFPICLSYFFPAKEIKLLETVYWVSLDLPFCYLPFSLSRAFFLISCFLCLPLTLLPDLLIQCSLTSFALSDLIVFFIAWTRKYAKCWFVSMLGYWIVNLFYMLTLKYVCNNILTN